MFSYHEMCLDKDVVMETWKDELTALGSGREMKFLKNVSLPGLAFTRAKKVCCITLLSRCVVLCCVV